jgi:hypothetical protein
MGEVKLELGGLVLTAGTELDRTLGRFSVVNEQQPNEKPIVKSTNAARQAVTGHNVRIVLAVSVVVAVIALGVTWISIAGH